MCRTRCCVSPAHLRQGTVTARRYDKRSRLTNTDGLVYLLADPLRNQPTGSAFEFRVAAGDLTAAHFSISYWHHDTLLNHDPTCAATSTSRPGRDSGSACVAPRQAVEKGVGMQVVTALVREPLR